MGVQAGGRRHNSWLVVLGLMAMLVLTMIGAQLAPFQYWGAAARCGTQQGTASAAAMAATAATAATTALATTTATVATRSQLIATENAQPGTKDWMIPDRHAATVEIQGYAGAVSASAGQRLTFYVSTQVAGMPYTVEVYRLGWYGGLGGRLMATMQELGQAQGYYLAKSALLVGCVTCRLDPQTKLVEAHWQPSFTLTIGDAWTTGLYVAKLTDANDRQAYVSFEVRGNPDAAYVVVVPDNTTAAYNDWGGYSLYHGPDGTLASRATTVSFDRPAPGWRYGVGNGLPYEIDAIRWMERGGYDLSYISSADLDENPGQLLNHKAYISLGHDEYWSQAMRDGIQQARDAGVGLAFLGANAGYWRIRYAPDAQGLVDRRIICYKDVFRDPLYRAGAGCVTGMFREAPISEPENALIGIMYNGWITAPAGFAWNFAPESGNSPLTQGTGLQPGAKYGCNLVGYEFDGIVANGDTPPDLHILATTQAHSDNGQPSTSNTTYYVAHSGALVFATGSIYWSYALDTLHVWDVASRDSATPCQRVSQGHAVPGMQKLMANVMAALVVLHSGAEWA